MWTQQSVSKPKADFAQFRRCQVIFICPYRGRKGFCQHTQTHGLLTLPEIHRLGTPWTGETSLSKASLFFHFKVTSNGVTLTNFLSLIISFYSAPQDVWKHLLNSSIQAKAWMMKPILPEAKFIYSQKLYRAKKKIIETNYRKWSISYLINF